MLDPDYALFAAAVHAGSIAAGARALGISPAMASKRLARLEARLGARLLHRTTRRLAPTERGARFHADVVAILAAASAAEARLTGTAPAGPLRIAAPTSFGRLHVAPVLAKFVADHPAVAAEITLSDGFVDLIGERIDVGVRITAELPAGLAAERLAPSRRILCAAPAYLAAAGTPASLADLAHHRLLAADGQLPWRLTRPGRTTTVAGSSAIRTDSSDMVRALAVAGAGIALRSLWDIGADLAAGRLVRVLPEWEGASDVAVYAVRPRGNHPPAAATALVAALAHAFSPPPWDAGD